MYIHASFTETVSYATQESHKKTFSHAPGQITGSSCLIKRPVCSLNDLMHAKRSADNKRKRTCCRYSDLIAALSFMQNCLNLLIESRMEPFERWTDLGRNYMSLCNQTSMVRLKAQETVKWDQKVVTVCCVCKEVWAATCANHGLDPVATMAAKEGPTYALPRVYLSGGEEAGFQRANSDWLESLYKKFYALICCEQSSGSVTLSVNTVTWGAWMKDSDVNFVNWGNRRYIGVKWNR